MLVFFFFLLISWIYKKWKEVKKVLNSKYIFSWEIKTNRISVLAINIEKMLSRSCFHFCFWSHLHIGTINTHISGEMNAYKSVFSKQSNKRDNDQLSYRITKLLVLYSTFHCHRNSCIGSCFHIQLFRTLHIL